MQFNTFENSAKSSEKKTIKQMAWKDRVLPYGLRQVGLENAALIYVQT
jgi:hypothetical protein